MTLMHLLAFNLTLLAALASPGPAMLMSLRTTLVSGRAAGIAAGIGLATAAAAWTLMALLGLELIFRMFPWAYLLLKMVGAAYLVYLAISIWRAAETPVDAQVTPRRRAWLGGLLVNLSNPKSMLFASAVLLVIFPQDMQPGEKALIVLNHLCVEIIAYGGFALAFSTPSVRAGYLRLKPVFDRTTALVLGALGLRLLLDRA